MIQRNVSGILILWINRSLQWTDEWNDLYDLYIKHYNKVSYKALDVRYGGHNYIRGVLNLNFGKKYFCNFKLKVNKEKKQQKKIYMILICYDEYDD